MLNTNTRHIKINPNTARGIDYAVYKHQPKIEPKGCVSRSYSVQCQRDGGLGYYYERLAIQVNVTAHRYYVTVTYRPTACQWFATRWMGVATKRSCIENDYTAIVLLGLRQVFPDIDKLHASLPANSIVPDLIQRLADVGAFEGYHSAILSTTLDD